MGQLTFWRVGGKRCTAGAQAAHGQVPFRSLCSVHSGLAAAAFLVVVTQGVLWKLARGGTQ